MSVLAIDQGTTSTRALLVEGPEKSTIRKVVEHRQIYPRSGWVEHDPEELVRNIQCCIDSCTGVTAIGIDNQGESCLAWNSDTKEAISPVIVWQDNRTHRTIEKLKSDGAEELVLKKTGLQMDSYFSASKLAWVYENVPEARQLHQRGRLRLGTTDAFFLDRLTGEFVTDITTASRTSLLDLGHGQWDHELCELFGVPVDALPRIVATTGDFGAIKSNGRNVPVTASIVDQQASLYGHGCRNPGDAKVTFGTGAFALALTGGEPYRSPGQGLLPTVAWQLSGQQPVYALDGGVYCAGSAVNWARALGLFESYEQLNRFPNPHAIGRGIVFVPALSGLACPHWDRSAAGLWIGLSLDTKPLDLVQAVLEGIAFRAAEVVGAMNELLPVEGKVSIDGGLAANPWFCQFLANVLNRLVVVQKSSELTALGTAWLAGGAGTEQGNQEQAVVTYTPVEDMSRYIGRFSEAVSRSAGWLH